MLPMHIFIYLPETRHHFISSFQTLLDPQRWRFTVQHLVVQILCVASVDISAFRDNLCDYSSVASRFSIPHNHQGCVHLLIWIPALADHTAHIQAQDNQVEINLALLPSFHDSFNGGQGFGAVPATMEAIDNLNTFTVGEEEEEEEEEESAVSDVSCAVCLEDIIPGDEASAMPCSHVYHDGCIRQWLEASRLCPLCRFALE